MDIPVFFQKHKKTNEKTKTWQKMNKVKWMQIKFEKAKHKKHEKMLKGKK